MVNLTNFAEFGQQHDWSSRTEENRLRDSLGGRIFCLPAEQCNIEVARLGCRCLAEQRERTRQDAAWSG